MRSRMIIWVAMRVWEALSGWLSTCFLLADEIALSMETQEYHVVD